MVLSVGLLLRSAICLVIGVSVVLLLVSPLYYDGTLAVICLFYTLMLVYLFVIGCICWFYLLSVGVFFGNLHCICCYLVVGVGAYVVGRYLFLLLCCDISRVVNSVFGVVFIVWCMLVYLISVCGFAWFIVGLVYLLYGDLLRFTVLFGVSVGLQLVLAVFCWLCHVFCVGSHS